MTNSNVAYLSSGSDPATSIDVRKEIRTLLESDPSLTQAKIARECSTSATRISQWLAGSYAGDNTSLESLLTRWLDARHARQAAMQDMPSAPEYIATPSGEAVCRALRFAQFAGDVAVIYGGAGVGKTASVAHYANASPSVFVATMTPASAGVVPALEDIALAVDAATTTGGAARLHRAICSRLRGTCGLLVIDEAQHLSVPALDQIRAVHDATGVGLALVGNEHVFTRMVGGTRAAAFDRLFSRIGKRVKLARATPDDAAAMADAWSISGRSSRALLEHIAGQPGALRSVTKVLRLASMYAASAGRQRGEADLQAAWHELGGIA